VFVRINPKTQEEPAWPRMPQMVRNYERKTASDISKPVIVLVTNRNYGDSIDDTLVVMRLGTALPMLKAFIDTDKERHT
jgi:hypothetical protein